MAIEKILLIDDDIELTALVSQFLIMNGFEVEVQGDGAKAISHILSAKPDLIVLDLMLPGLDGLSICRQIREDFFGPIIMLTALDDDIDEVTGLEVGADDYLSKPIKPRVLLAHIRAQLRRHTHISQQLDTHIKTALSDELVIDATKRKVSYQQQEISLTCAEFDLLWILASHAGKIISRDELHQEIFRLAYDGIDRSIDLRISRLRKKLSDNSKEPNIIKTIRNKGYLLAK